MNIVAVAEIGGIFLPILQGGPLPVISSRVIALSIGSVQLQLPIFKAIYRGYNSI